MCISTRRFSWVWPSRLSTRILYLTLQDYSKKLLLGTLVSCPGFLFSLYCTGIKIIRDHYKGSLALIFLVSIPSLKLPLDLTFSDFTAQNTIDYNTNISFPGIRHLSSPAHTQPGTSHVANISYWLLPTHHRNICQCIKHLSMIKRNSRERKWVVFWEKKLREIFPCIFTGNH